MSTPVQQLDLPLQLDAESEAFISGYKAAWFKLRKGEVPRASLLFDALHKFQRSVS